MRVDCIVCSAECSRNWRYGTSDVYRCTNCDLEFAVPRKAADVAYYQSSEQYAELHAQALTNELHPGLRSIIRKLIESCDRYLSPTQTRAADIGCGPGYMLAALKQRGFDCLGIDFNPDMCRIVTDVYAIPARTATLHELAAENQRFDLLVFSHVLEHLQEPMSALKDLKTLLMPGGLLFICLPNREFIRERKLLRSGKLANYHYPPHHLNFWSADSLRYAMRAAGFRIAECYAQAYPDALVAEHSLRTARGVSNPIAARIVAGIAAFVGSTLRLEGSNLFGVAINGD